MRIISQKLSSCPRCTIAAVGTCFVLLIVVLFAVDLENRYRAAIDGAKQSAANYAAVLAEHTARTFEAVDRSLREAALVRMALQADPPTKGADEVARTETANEALRHLKQTSALLVSIGWTNADGDLIAHSNDGEPTKRNLADLPHFIAQRDDGDDRLYIAPPFPSPT